MDMNSEGLGQVSMVLGISKKILVQAMTDAGVEVVPSLHQAKTWRGSTSVPDWVRAARIARDQLRYQSAQGARKKQLKPVVDAEGRILTKEDRDAERSRMRKAARSLCPSGVSGVLGLKYQAVASAMQDAGVAEPITIAAAREWAKDPSLMPQWLQPLVMETAARKILVLEQRRINAEHDKVEADIRHQRELDRQELIEHRLSQGEKRFSRSDREYVDTLAFSAAKNLARGATLDMLSTMWLTALSINGIDPLNHQTWPVHAGDCNGQGINCTDGQREAEIAKAMDNLDRQQERAKWSSDNALQVASGRFEIGQLVSAWCGDRIGMVVKHNRVTVKVRMVGPRAEGYQPIEKTIKPHFLSPIIEAAEGPAIDEVITVCCWDGREREARVVDALKPLFLAEYKIQSGKTRQAWFDLGRII